MPATETSRSLHSPPRQFTAWILKAAGVLTLVPAAILMPGVARAAEAVDETERPAVRDLVPMPTLGGAQVWADQLFFHQWRIQRNVLTGECRLLDGNDFRHGSGTLAQCQALLDRIKQERNLPPWRGKVVIVLHGIADGRGVMKPLCRYLEEQGGYEPVNVTYPSTRQGLAEHAKDLASIVDHLEGVEEIHLVGYSLGGIVIRRFFAEELNRRHGKIDPRFGRMVMIGPPNQGSQLAARLGDNPLFELLLGKAGKQLGPLWAWEAGSLATPPIEFGIVAGGCGDGRGFNPLLPGDDDGIVTVESTRLAGASDWIVVPALHALLPRLTKVHQYTLRFLQHGYFVAPDQRTPIQDGR
jgi:pimeloyl-ACP methyl ester carboxylesterase